VSHLALLWRHRALISVLVRRELAARYRASVLGFFWSMLNPLLLLIVYAVVFTTVFQPRFEGGEPYPLFLFVGLLPWIFFSGSVLESAVTLVDNGPLLAKVMCPPEIFPAVIVVAQLVHHLLAMPILLAALAAAAHFGLHPFPWTVLLLPVAIVPWVLLAFGAALAVAAGAVHLRDVRDLIGHVLNFLFFASPIIYSLEALELDPILMAILRGNPLASLVTVYRDLAFAGRIPASTTIAAAYLVGVAGWFLGAMLFSRLRDTLVEAV
jgi:ABC-type polysaccharide/polyol phosphate export permease